MRIKLILIAAILVFIASVPLILAAEEYVYTLINFDIVSSQEMTVTLRAKAGTKSEPDPGNQTVNNIIFNTTTGDSGATWNNASVQGGLTQDDDNPIITIDNTGTAQMAQVDMSTNDSIGTCLKLRFSNETIAYPPLLSLNETTNVTLVTTYDWDEDALKVWLFANFTVCKDSDDDSTFLFVYGTW